MNTGCDIDSLDVSGKAIEHGAPDDFAELFTPWGALALDLGITPSKAIKIKKCLELLVLYYFQGSEETRNVKLALEFNSITQIKALKIITSLDINPVIASKITDESQLEALNALVTNPEFRLAQKEALNTNKMPYPKYSLKFNSLEQVEALKLRNITAQQALNVTSNIQLEALNAGIPYYYAIQFKLPEQLEAFKMNVPPEYALKFNSSLVLQNLHQWSYLKNPASMFFALYMQNSKGAQILQNMTNSCCTAQQQHSFNYTYQDPKVTGNLLNSSLIFDNEFQKQAVIEGVKIASIIMKFNNKFQIQALQHGLSPVQALEFSNNNQVAALKYGVQYPEALKFYSIHVRALKTNKTSNIMDAFKFKNLVQVKAFEVKTTSIEEAIAINSTYMLEALTLGATYKHAVQFYNAFQIAALKMQVPAKIALEFVTPHQINAISRNISYDLAVKFKKLYQITTLDLGASPKKASEITWLGSLYFYSKYWIKSQFNNYEIKIYIDNVIDLLPWCVLIMTLPELRYIFTPAQVT